MSVDKEKIWIVHKVKGQLLKLEDLLITAGYDCLILSDCEMVLDAMTRHGPPSVLIIHEALAKSISALQEEKLRDYFVGSAIIIVAPSLSLDQAVSSFRLGAFGYLKYPLDAEDAFTAVQNALVSHNYLTPEIHFESENPEKEIIGISKPMQEVYKIITKLSQTTVTVLLTGESGTGKELIARALHRHSPRWDKPFVAINMAAIPDELIESELFGHERGAFTGAGQQHRGFFEQAEGGTLFLDEIGDMSIGLQTRLLRVIAEREFHPVGSSRPKNSNVRIIAATHHNLYRNVREGKFREDLYHRLNVIKIELPPLRDRGEDVLLLVRSYLDHFARELGVESKRLTSEVEAHLLEVTWPGNVRQLENMCRWLTVMADGNRITLDMLPNDLFECSSADQPRQIPAWQDALRSWIYEALSAGQTNIAHKVYSPAEKIMIQTALEISKGRRDRAAKLLGLGRNTLTRKMAEESFNELDKSVSR